MLDFAGKTLSNFFGHTTRHKTRFGLGLNSVTSYPIFLLTGSKVKYLRKYLQQMHNSLSLTDLFKRSLRYLALGLLTCIFVGCSEQNEGHVGSVQIVSDSVASRINEMIISGHEIIQAKFGQAISPEVDVSRVRVRFWANMSSFKKAELAHVSLTAGHHGLNTWGERVLPLSVSVTNSGDSPSAFWIMKYDGVDFRSAKSIASTAVREALTEQEKALKLWRLVVEMKYHHFDSPGAMDPVIALNGYGYGLCGSDANNLAVLANSAGLSGRIRPLTDHVVSEIFVDSDWAMFDANHEFILENGGKLMSVDEIQSNLDKLPQFDPVGWENKRMVEVYGTQNKIAQPINSGFIMNPVLGPGDSVNYSFIDESGPSQPSLSQILSHLIFWAKGR